MSSEPPIFVPASSELDVPQIKFEFNHPKIIQGYIDQCIEKFAWLKQFEPRIKVGTQGGLCFILFPNGAPHPEKVSIHGDINRQALRGYWESLDEYLNFAFQIAQPYGFSYVGFNTRGLCQVTPQMPTNTYNAAIGKTKIDSERDVEQFVKMSRTFHSLDPAYEKLKEAAGKLS
jgi:hypothetical protein